MKKSEWVTLNRMKFESLHKTFNKQVTMITTGNHMGNTVRSFFIRPFNRLECNGRVNEPGHLQEYDLNNFQDKYYPSDLRGVKDFIRREGKAKTLILYVFFHYNGEKKITHGAIITDGEHNHIKTCFFIFNRKSMSVIEEARKYVTN